MLKQLIQRLLDSRTTPAQAAHSASSVYAEPTLQCVSLSQSVGGGITALFGGLCHA